jgi:uncharacterized protein (DUF305 family)
VRHPDPQYRYIRGMKVMVVAFAAVVLAAGCGGAREEQEPQPAESTPNIVQPGGPGEPPRKLTPEEAAKIGSTPVTEADVKFMQDMIHHHSQAIEMTGWVPERASSRGVKLIAQRMARSQEAEVEVMERWLQAQGVEPPSEHAGHGGTLMPGMLTDEQMERLEAGDGRRFDRLFLRYMTQHHRGALQMVGELRDSGGGLQSEIDKLAREIATDQEIEIERMRELLAEVA